MEFSAVNRRRPSRETPLGPGAKKDGCSRRLATWQHAFLSTSTMLYNIFARACAYIKISKFSFCYLFVAVIERLLASSSKISEKASLRRAIFTTKSLRVVAGNFATSFSLKFLSIFEHILGSIEPIILIWVSVERFFPPADLEYRWWQFWSKLIMSEVEQKLHCYMAGIFSATARPFIG